MQGLLAVLLLAAQLDKPPEFSAAPGFKKSEVDAAIDSAAHTSGQKSESAKAMVRRLVEWPRSLSDAENAAWRNSLAALARGALAEAADSFAAGARAFPGSARQQAGQAAAVYAQGNYGGAAKILLAAARLHPGELRLIPYVAEVLDADPGVLRQLEAWAKAHPKSAEAQLAYGVALIPSAKIVAEKHLRQAAQLFAAEQPDARPHLALARVHEGDSRKVVADLTVALGIEGNNAEAHYRIAQEYRRLGQTEQAEEHLRRYRELKR